MHVYVGQCGLYSLWTVLLIGRRKLGFSLETHRTEIASVKLECVSVPLRIILCSCHSVCFRYYSLQYGYTFFLFKLLILWMSVRPAATVLT